MRNRINDKIPSLSKGSHLHIDKQNIKSGGVSQKRVDSLLAVFANRDLVIRQQPPKDFLQTSKLKKVEKSKTSGPD